MKGSSSSRASADALLPSRLTSLRQKCVPSSRAPAKPASMLGKGQFSIYLPRRVDSEYYVKSPVKVKAEMFLCPEHLGVGGLHLKAIPCNAKVEKLTEDNRFGVVNVPIKIEAEVVLSPGINYSCKTTTPLPGEDDDDPSCTVRIIEPVQGPHPDGREENWQVWGGKREIAVRTSTGSTPRHPLRFKGEKSPTKQIMVEELKLDDNCKKAKDLRRQLTANLDQLLEQNRKIQRLQERLREEESKGAESSEKVHVAEQQCKVLEQKLKAAECRAKVAEHRAEAIKQRTKVLSVSCGYQGVQLKDLARQVDYFVKTVEAQRLVALDSNQKLSHGESLRGAAHDGDGEGRAAAVVESLSGLCTIARTRPFRLRNPYSFDVETEIQDNSPDLNSPSTNCFYQTVTVQELSDKYVLFLCRRLQVDPHHRLRLERGENRKAKPTNSGAGPVTFPPMHVELLLNQLLQMAPTWHVEFESSLQRADELIRKCSAQASTLRDLSRELDCFPSTLRGDAGSGSALLPSTSNVPIKGKVRFVEEDVTPSPQSTPVSEARVEHSLPPHAKVTHQTNKCLEKYLFNLTHAAATFTEVKKKVPQIDVWIQTLPLGPELEQVAKPETCTRPTSPRHDVCVTSLPYRYEIKAWRLAFRTMVQGLLLWLGLLFLPEVSFRHHSPPPT